MLTAGLRLGPAPGSGRPLGCPAVARSRRLVLYSPARRLLSPIAAWSASEEWERRQDGSDPTERGRQLRRQGGEGRHPGHDRQVGQRSGSTNARSQRSRGGSTNRERSSRSTDGSRQRSSSSSGGGGSSSSSSGGGSSSSKDGSSSSSSSSSSSRRPSEDITPLMEAVRGCRSCTDVLQLVQQEDGKAASEGCGGVHIFVLSNALDSMKKKAAREGSSEADRQAVAQLLRLATERLGEFGPRGLVAFIRCAAAFKGVLQPGQLAAWQDAVQPHKLCKASSQDVSNMLLSLGTLVESEERLAAVVSQPLAEQLLQHAAELATAGKLSSLQQPANCLYGAALLGLQPTARQAHALFGAVQLALEQPQQRGDHIAVTQVLLACAKMADVQPEAGAAPTPGEDPFHRFYPGAGLVDALLRRATSASLSPWEATQIVGACGGLLHMPGQQEGTALLAALREHADNMTGIAASALLVGCARLGAPLGPAAIEACVAAVEREGPTSSGRAASNVAWALAVLEACDLRTWQRLTTVATSNIESLANVELQQWAQAHQLMQLQHGQGVPCPPELLQRSQAAWAAQLQREQQQQQRGKAASRFERLLAAAVAEMAGGHAVQPAHIATGSSGEPLALVDVALPQLRIAAEADGPTHFLRNRQGSGGQPLPDGPTRARDRLLEGHGWQVVAVPFRGYQQLADAGATDAELQAGLRRYLATSLAAAIAERAGNPSSSGIA